MEIIQITGGRTLAGSIRPAAAKNSVLPLLAATLLCGGACTLRAVPRLSDVDTSLALLAAAGGCASWQGRDIHTRPAQSINGQVPAALAGAMRASVFYLAPLLCRTGAVSLPLPGGCRLGPRPVDIHLAGLAAMGAQTEVYPERMVLRRTGPLHGVDFNLRLPSVGATLTLMMAGCCAVGTTVLRGAACEPEIEDVASFLNACGGSVSGAGTPVLVIQGLGGMLPGGADYTPLPDRIAAATYAAAAAAAGGEVRLVGCRIAHIATFLQFLRAAGCTVGQGSGGITIKRDPARPLRGGQEIYAACYPGFATDMAPLAAAVLLGAQGASQVYDGLFQNRFACAGGFAALGAGVSVCGQTLHIAGDAKLRGAVVPAPDLRGGAALAVAALAACGCTTIEDPGYIRRGYEHLAQDFAALGADCRCLAGAA